MDEINAEDNHLINLNYIKEPRYLAGSVDAQLVCQGAEARAWQAQFLGRQAIIKQRFSKKYRHPLLDKTLTTQRLKSEVRSIMRARKLGVLTPVPYLVESSAASIYMEFVSGQSMKQTLAGVMNEEEVHMLMTQVGSAVAKLHDGGLVHGDLTTSNMIVRESDQRVVLIDFGLAYTSTNAEDKGVDLYVLERALTAAHADRPGLFDMVLAAYKSSSCRFSATYNRFVEIRLRGRKRTMVG